MLQNPLNTILEVVFGVSTRLCFRIRKNRWLKLYINLNEQYEDEVLRNTNMATPRTVETKCYQDTGPDIIQNDNK
jgi:hypothetical protein